MTEQIRGCTKPASRAGRRIVSLACFALIVGIGLDAQAWAQNPDRWIGLEVFIKPGADPPRIKDGAQTPPFLRYRVERVEDDRLWITAGAVSGWVDAGDLIPCSESIRFFTSAVRSDPQAAWAYAWRALVWYDKDELDIAIADYSESLQLDAQDAVTFDNRGIAWLEKKDYDRALADFSQAHRLDPNEASFLDHRGLSQLAKGETALAIADFTEAIRRDPRGISAYDHRGFAHARDRQYDRALADYESALRIDLADVWAANALAWLRATCPVATYRDGTKAVGLAMLALKGAQEDDPYLLGTRAAAEAEAGNFDEAVAWQSKALALFPDNDPDLAEHRARLALYQARRPYREGSPRP